MKMEILSEPGRSQKRCAPQTLQKPRRACSVAKNQMEHLLAPERETGAVDPGRGGVVTGLAAAGLAVAGLGGTKRTGRDKSHGAAIAAPGQTGYPTYLRKSSNERALARSAEPASQLAPPSRLKAWPAG